MDSVSQQSDFNSNTYEGIKLVRSKRSSDHSAIQLSPDSTNSVIFMDSFDLGTPINSNWNEFHGVIVEMESKDNSSDADTDSQSTLTDDQSTLVPTSR